MHADPNAGGPQRHRLLTMLMALACAIIVSAAVFFAYRPSENNQSEQTASPDQPTAYSLPERPQPTGPAPTAIAPNFPVTVDLSSAFAELSASLNAVIGLSYAPVGGTSDATTLGQGPSGPAWSTSKVPVVLAALQAEPAPTVTAEMDAAITRSDNDAAEQVWASLGDPTTAASKVDEVLQKAHDSTVVQSQRVRPGFTAFGQTIWPLSNQAQFMSFVACDSQAAPVLDLMGHISSDQSWGLGRIPGALFKGGWGPSESGQYLVRQLGLLSTPSGKVAVALAAEPTSGSFNDGVQTLDAMADWVSSHLANLPAGTCP